MRMAMGIVFKRIITQTTPNQYHFWLKLEKPLKEDIKNDLLFGLITKDQLVRKAAADAVACIAIIVKFYNLFNANYN
jgi:hypothetical protein